ncbi:MAG: type II toxin-antitoxin system prevent-host-death family antitoxin [Betaproteobacteria bacterium]|nr:type II toxin-antitoxin system prevent-host-death family antitoxin [Betaproteobacteria bacterium]
MQVNMLDAKSQLSKLVKAALEGEEVIIANKGVPAVRLVPVDARPPKRKPGAWAHLAEPTDDAFSPGVDRRIAAELTKSALTRPKPRKPSRKSKA